MQKCIRRGFEEEAQFWATELDLAGYGAYVWKRLRIIASEDIGLADPSLCVQVRNELAILFRCGTEKRSGSPVLSTLKYILDNQNRCLGKIAIYACNPLR
jgi:hypothetical protein